MIIAKDAVPTKCHKVLESSALKGLAYLQSSIKTGMKKGVRNIKGFQGPMVALGLKLKLKS
jgi:hypothetical protein